MYIYIFAASLPNLNVNIQKSSHFDFYPALVLNSLYRNLIYMSFRLIALRALI